MILVVKNYTKQKLSFLIIILLTSGFLLACDTNKNVVNEVEKVAMGIVISPRVDADNGQVGAGNKVVAEAQEFAMGTVVTQKVYGENGQVAINQAIERIRSLEGLLTFNAPEGDIYNLNNNAGKKEVELNPLTIEVIKKAQQVAELSNGAFDVTIGPVVKSWGIGTENQRIPSAEELHKMLPAINYKDLEFDDHAAYLKNPGQQVDLGGIAKGYAGDEVIQIYKKNGIKSAYINLGGNVMTLGGKPDGSPWTVGIRNPRIEEAKDGQQILGSITVRDKAVVTAGDGERYFIQDGIRYHHIIDPHTGYPAQSNLMSVTLVTDSSFDADALDTAVFILGLERGMDLIEKYGGIEAIFITTDRKIIVTDGLKGNFKLFEGDNEYQLVQ